jgi:hypothetical protein
MCPAHDSAMPFATLRRSHVTEASDEAPLPDRRPNARPAASTVNRHLAQPMSFRPSPEARRPLLTAAGVLLVVTCAGIGATLAARVDHRQSYLAVGRFVPEGAVVAPGDLTTVDMVASSGVTIIPAAEEDAVAGLRAAEPLPAGSLLVPADLTRASPLPADEALVGASLSPDQLPSGLANGDKVLVVLSSASGLPAGDEATSSQGNATPGGSTPQTSFGEGIVYSLTIGATNATTGEAASDLVTLEVPLSDAAGITAASAAGDVSLAELASPASSPKPTSSPRGSGTATR